MAKFNTNDVATLLAQPGFLYYRDYGSAGSYNKAVFANGATFAPAIESTEVAFDDVGTVYDQIANETVELTLDSGRVLDFDFIEAISGGIYTKTNIAGTPVVGGVQVVSSGSWAYDTPFLLTGQNASGLVPTITTVVGSVDGALVSGTDYFVVKLEGAGWAIYVKDSATVTTTAQNITITSSYTPTAGVKLTRGGIKTINPIEIAYQTVNSDGDYVTYTFYKCSTNGALGHGFGSENSAAPITMSLSFTAKKDTNRTTGDQLFKQEIGGVSLG